MSRIVLKPGGDKEVRGGKREEAVNAGQLRDEGRDEGEQEQGHEV